jgi:hypothetical protein
MEENNSPVAGFEVFDSPEAMIASEETQVETPQQESQPVQEEQVSEPVTQEAPDAAQPEPQPEVQPEPQAEPQQEQPEYSQEDIESAVLNYASERLGMQIESFEQLQGAQQQTALDERVAKIAEFVETTGRGPEDWFRYQSLDPSGMDDLTAVRVNLAAEYPNLSSSEINLLVQNSYPMDDKANDANTIQMSQLRLKVDAQKARAAISDLRDRYTAPAPEQDMDMDPIVDDQWISTMSKEVDQMTGLEFDLGGDKSFTFGFDDATKNRVKASNANIENFFDPFVDDEGNWNYDALSTHIAVTQNIDAIVRSAYQQGLGDGQRGLVDKAANVSAAAPKQTGQEQNNPLSDQVRTLLRNSSSGLTFKI